AWALMEEVEALGGMAKAIETGIPKMRIEEAAAKKQARIDSGKDIIVGVNRYISEHDVALAILEVDNTKVRQQQLERLARIKQERNEAKVQAALEALTQAASDGKANLLALAVNAARERATLGEISAALEKVFGRYQASIRTISGVYQKEIAMNSDFQEAMKL